MQNCHFPLHQHRFLLFFIKARCENARLQSWVWQRSNRESARLPPAASRHTGVETPCRRAARSTQGACSQPGAVPRVTPRVTPPCHATCHATYHATCHVHRLHGVRGEEGCGHSSILSQIQAGVVCDQILFKLRWEVPEAISSNPISSTERIKVRTSHSVPQEANV